MSLGILPNGYEELSQKASTLLSRVKLLLTFYENIGKDMIKAFENLTEFVWSLDELEHYNENELLILANKIFKTERFNVSVEYYKYKLSKDEINLIENTIRPMELSGGES